MEFRHSMGVRWSPPELMGEGKVLPTPLHQRIMKKKMATEISCERRGEGDPTIPPGATLVQEPEPSLLNIPTSVGKFKLKKRHIFMAIAVTVFALLLNIQSVEGFEAN
jgi:hypothetical protein